MPNYIELTDFELEYLKIRLQLRKLMQEAWRNRNLFKWKFVYCFNCTPSGSISTYVEYSHKLPSDIYFLTWSSLDNAIFLIGEDRLKKYYFCVEGNGGFGR